jgi:succinate dehydrogenase / fumarate reductase cytochrome b subunit
VLRKQLVAVTGLVWIGFVITHLAGNLLIYAGPEAFNHYAEKLQGLGLLLWAARAGLLLSFVIHVYFTAVLTVENWKAAGARYAVRAAKGENSLAAKTMIYSSVVVFAFILLHLCDFTFGDKQGPPSIVHAPGGLMGLGLFGLVWNSFLKPWRALFYIVAMCSVGLHLAHGVESTFQTLGLHDERYTPWVKRASAVTGALVAAGFSSIPVYIMIRHYTVGLGE